MIVRNRSWPAVSLETRMKGISDTLGLMEFSLDSLLLSNSPLCSCDYTGGDGRIDHSPSKAPGQMSHWTASPLPFHVLAPRHCSGVPAVDVRMGYSPGCQKEQGEFRGCCSKVILSLPAQRRWSPGRWHLSWCQLGIWGVWPTNKGLSELHTHLPSWH